MMQQTDILIAEIVMSQRHNSVMSQHIISCHVTLSTKIANDNKIKFFMSQRHNRSII